VLCDSYMLKSVADLNLARGLAYALFGRHTSVELTQTDLQTVGSPVPSTGIAFGVEIS